MNCKFCNQPMTKPLTQTVSNISVYECYRCPRSVRFMYVDEVLEKYVIFLSKKNKNLDDELYAVVFWPNDDKATLSKVQPHRRSGGDYFEGYFFEHPMMTFGHMPDVTPGNIHEKFKLYMLFS